MSEEKLKYNIDQLKREFAALRKFAAMLEAQKEQVGCQKIYIDMTGDLEAAFVLDELIYWTNPRKGQRTGLRVWKDGVLWLAVPRSEWWDRKRLTERQSDLAIKKLVEQDLVIKSVHKFNGSTCVHLRLNVSAFFEKYAKALTEAHPPEDESDTIIKDIDDLYAMMGMDRQGELPNGDSQELPNGELPNGYDESPNGKTFNNLHTTSTQEEEEEGKAIRAYEENIGALTPMIAEKLHDLIDEHTPKWVIAAIREAVNQGVRNINYIAAILARWKVQGYGTPYPRKNGNGHKKSKPQPQPPEETPEQFAERQRLAREMVNEFAQQGK